MIKKGAHDLPVNVVNHGGLILTNPCANPVVEQRVERALLFTEGIGGQILKGTKWGSRTDHVAGGIGMTWKLEDVSR